MDLDEAFNEEIFITSVSFDDGAMEVNFMQARRQADGVMTGDTMRVAINTDELRQVYLELQDNLRYVIEHGELMIRNPVIKTSSDPRARIHQRFRDAAEDNEIE